MAEEENPQETPVEEGPAGKYAGRTMVHLQRTGRVAGAGHVKDTEASNAEIGSSRQEQWRDGPMAAAEPEVGTARTSALGCTDAT